MQQTRSLTFERALPIAFTGKFPPNASALAGLGFDSISTTKSAITIRKSRRGMHNLPISGLQIVLRRTSVSLKASYPHSSDPSIEEMRACATLLRVLLLFPSIQANASGLAKLILPPLAAAEEIANTPYESLAKKYRDTHADLASLLSKNRALLRSSEEGALSSLELERQLSALLARTRKLETVSDDTLLELVQDHLASHRGKFDAAAFSRAHSLPPARAEEGLERLLASGAVKKVGGSLLVHSPHSHGTFEQQHSSALSSIKSALRLPKFGKVR